MPRKNSTSAGASVGTMDRAITRPFSSRTEATVIAWWTSNATYLVVRFMRAAPCCGPRVLVDSMATARGALSTCVRRRPVARCLSLLHTPPGSMRQMSRLNWRRALLGGVLAAVLWGVLYAPVHPLVEGHTTLGRPVLPITPFRGAALLLRVLVVLTGFVQGIATVCLYAAIRPRFGAEI